jgi:hypothetical protein
MTPANDPLEAIRFLEPENQNAIPERIFALRAVWLGASSHLIWRPMVVWVATKLDLSGKCAEDLICSFTKPFLAESADEAAARYPGFEVRAFQGPRAAWQHLTRWDRHEGKQYERRVWELVRHKAA